MITENLPTLKIHKLTLDQYERERQAGRLDPNALYLTPDVDEQQIQPDWNETDTTSPAYIKNKPTFYGGDNVWFSGDVKVGGTGYDDENAQTLATQEFVMAAIKAYIAEAILNGRW